MNFKTTFDSIATKVTRWTGSYKGFAIALLGIIIWSILGPVYNFSENWQLVINTSTTIITFLMVFLIQYSQNKYTKALHIKID
jgi:low affinity Fe/Cu permease